mmetsp:Transcript_45214/g.102092  ORF Transcript_45214/g.102092 Transcript_45214/m.102092 type:complete len:202 (+) Transcript_45214:681-1286(+)
MAHHIPTGEHVRMAIDLQMVVHDQEASVVQAAREVAPEQPRGTRLQAPAPKHPVHPVPRIARGQLHPARFHAPALGRAVGWGHGCHGAPEHHLDPPLAEPGERGPPRRGWQASQQPRAPTHERHPQPRPCRLVGRWWGGCRCQVVAAQPKGCGDLGGELDPDGAPAHDEHVPRFPQSGGGLEPSLGAPLERPGVARRRRFG